MDDIQAIDGDTIVLPSGERVRISGINTGEIGLPGAQLATQATQEFVNQPTELSSEDGNDVFGRTLADVTNTETGSTLSNTLLSKGLAQARPEANAQQRATSAIFASKLSDFERATLSAPDRKNVDNFLAFQEQRLNTIKSPLFRPAQSRVKKSGGFTGNAFGRGVDQVQQLGFALTQLVGESINSDTLEKIGKRGVNKQSLELFLNPRETKSFTDSEGFVETLGSIYESVIEQAPNIGTTLLTALASGGLGAGVTAALGKVAAGEAAASAAVSTGFRTALGSAFNSGAKAGAVSASVGLNTGETKLEFDREGIKNNSKVFFTGLLKGALDFASLSAIPGVGRLVGSAARASKIPVKTARDLFKEIPFSIAKAAVTEGSTEALQTVLDKAAVNSSLGRAWSQADTDEIVEAGVIGAVTGGLLGGAGSTGRAIAAPSEIASPPPDPVQGELFPPLVGPLAAPAAPAAPAPPVPPPPPAPAGEQPVQNELVFDEPTKKEKAAAKKAKVKAKKKVVKKKAAKEKVDKKKVVSKKSAEELSREHTREIIASRKFTNATVKKITKNKGALKPTPHPATVKRKARVIQAKKDAILRPTTPSHNPNAGPQGTVIEPEADVAAQKRETANGNKKATFAAKEVKVTPKQKARIKKAKDSLGLTEVHVNDGTQQGIASFRTHEEGVAFAKRVKEVGVNDANLELVLEDGAVNKTSIAPAGSQVLQLKDRNGNVILEELVDRKDLATRKKVFAARRKSIKGSRVIASPVKAAISRRFEKVLNEKSTKPSTQEEKSLAVIEAKKKLKELQAPTKQQKAEAARDANRSAEVAEIVERVKGRTLGDEFAEELGAVDALVDEDDIQGSIITEEEIPAALREIRDTEVFINQDVDTDLEVPERSTAEGKKNTRRGSAILHKQDGLKAAKAELDAFDKENAAIEQAREKQKNAPQPNHEALLETPKETKSKPKSKSKSKSTSTAYSRDKALDSLGKAGTALRKIAKRHGGTTVLLRRGHFKEFFAALPEGVGEAIQDVVFKVNQHLVVSFDPELASPGRFNAGKVSIGRRAFKRTDALAAKVFLHELVHSVTIVHAAFADAALAFFRVNNNTKEADLLGTFVNTLKDAFTDDTAAQASLVASGFTQNQIEELIKTAFLLDQKSHKLTADLLRGFFEGRDALKPGIKAGDINPNAATSAAEFIAEAIFNPFAAEALDKVERAGKGRKGRPPLLARIFSAIKKYFGVTKGSVLEDLMNLLPLVAEAESNVDSSIGRPFNALASTKANLGRAFEDVETSPKVNAITAALRNFFTVPGSIAAGKKVSGFLGAAFTPLKTTYRRLAAVSSTLADSFYTPPGKTGSKLGWMNLADADAAVLKAQFSETFTDRFTKEQVEKAYEEVIHGKAKSLAARQLVKFFKSARAYSTSSKLARFVANIGNVGRNGVYFPQIHNFQFIRENREKFKEFLLTGNKGKPFTFSVMPGVESIIEEEHADSIIDSLLVSPDSSTSVGSVTTSATKRRVLTDPAYQAAAFDAGWLNKDPVSSVETYVTGITKQRQFEEKFGDFVALDAARLVPVLAEFGFAVSDAKGNISEKLVEKALDSGLLKRDKFGKYSVWKADAKLQQELKKIQAEKGTNALREAELTIKALEGLIGIDMNPKVRKTQQWLVVAQSYLILAMSTISSLPELGVLLAGTAGKSPRAAWSGLLKFATDTKNSFAVAKALGALPDAMVAGQYTDTSSFNGDSAGPRRALEKFFKFNGNTLFNNAIRSIGTNIALDYFIDMANTDPSALTRWGITAKQVKTFAKNGNKPRTAEGQIDPVSQAVIQFVDAHSVRPSPANKAVFGNDPRFMLISQLKNFFYAYGAVIIPEIARTFSEALTKTHKSGRTKAFAALRAAMPLYITGLVTMPLAALSLGIKDSIRDKDEKKRRRRLDPDITSDLFRTLRATGLMGPADLALSFYDAEQFGQSGLIRALGPTAGHLDTLIKYGPTSPEFVQRSTPVLGVLQPKMWEEWKKAARKERRASDN